MSDDEWVQRALGAARHHTPVPDDVAARLDARLADLHRERATLAAPTQQRQVGRRPVGRYLLAAAAVAAVVAVGFPVVRQLGQGTTATSGSASSAASSGEAPSPSTAAQPQDAAPSAAQGSREGLIGPGVVLSTSSLESDLQRQRALLTQAAQAYALGGTEISSTCFATPAAGTDGAVVQLDGQRVLAELSAPADGRRVVRLLSCRDGATVGRASIAR